ncbi:MAG: hypothetical protein ABIH03_13220 [Pseudomonadota bacterium]
MSLTDPAGKVTATLTCRPGSKSTLLATPGIAFQDGVTELTLGKPGGDAVTFTMQRDPSDGMNGEVPLPANFTALFGMGAGITYDTTTVSFAPPEGTTAADFKLICKNGYTREDETRNVVGKAPAVGENGQDMTINPDNMP